MNCENCDNHSREKFVFESAMAMAERTIKRLWIVVILLIVLFVGTNAAWIVYEKQFEDVEVMIHQESEADGNGVALNANGEVYYGGESNTDN